MNILLPVLAILIPYKLYGENNLKKLVVVGLVITLLLAVTMSTYQLGLIYEQPHRTLNSDEFQDGTVDQLYGDPDTTFTFTVNLTKDYVEGFNYTVYLNLTLATAGRVQQTPYEGYKMRRVAESNLTYQYSVQVSDLEERLFGHRFSVRRNRTGLDDELDYDWHRTSIVYGPITIEESRAFQLLTFEYFTSTAIIFLLGMGLLWVKKRMDKSVSESVEGLEEKEEELEDSCPECGALLEGAKVCKKCGWEIGAKEEPGIEEVEETDQLEPREARKEDDEEG
ncbi:MAG: hypothetical protein V5A88_02955 [Candidatus Thermoplasmatota archaeon]